MLTLRHFTAEDAPALGEAVNDDPDVGELIHLLPNSPVSRVERVIEQFQYAPGELILALDVDGELAGGVALRVQPANQSAAATYWTVPKLRRQGVAVEALRQVAALAFDRLGLARLELFIEPDNAASAAVARAAGFAHEGTMRAVRGDQDGNRVDVGLWSLLPGDGATPGGKRGG